MATSTHTDRICIAPPAQVSALLTQIAARMFDSTVAAGSDGVVLLSLRIFEAWKLIREVAHLYGTHGAVYLAPDLLDQLTDALIFAHEVSHSLEPGTQVPEQCGCEMAERMRKAMTAIFAAALETPAQEAHDIAADLPPGSSLIRSDERLLAEMGHEAEPIG